MGDVSGRLEEARRTVQGRWGQDFRAWWRELQGEDYECSYSGARRWHEDRDPPASYVARVCQVHDVRPSFLLLGERPVLEDHRPVPRIRRALEEHRAEIDDVLTLLEEET